MSDSATVRLPDAEWQHKAGLDALCLALGAEADEARYVGGAVRDSLLGLAVKDVDIATVHPPRDVVRRIEAAGFRAVPTGLAHGTITAILHRWPVEITTLRHDLATDGRHATVAFGADWRADAARRDFTINALYAEPAGGAIHDYFGGLDDLAARRVRFIGDPFARIAEDHLRILRYYRFTARFGTIDTASADHAACVAQANMLMALSRERIADELMKLLVLPDPAEVLAAMVAGGILTPVLPEIWAEGVGALRALVAAEQAASMTPDALRRLVALLPPDPVLADQIGARLRLSNKARARMQAALRVEEADSPRALAYRLGVVSAIDQMLLGRAFTRADANALAGWEPPHLPLSGGDLIAMGLPAGPIVARTLQQVEQLWIAADFPGPDATRGIAAQRVAAVLRSSQ
jgi:poly(A) polymerase